MHSKILNISMHFQVRGLSDNNNVNYRPDIDNKNRDLNNESSNNIININNNNSSLNPNKNYGGNVGGGGLAGGGNDLSSRSDRPRVNDIPDGIIHNRSSEDHHSNYPDYNDPDTDMPTTQLDISNSIPKRRRKTSIHCDKILTSTPIVNAPDRHFSDSQVRSISYFLFFFIYSIFQHTSISISTIFLFQPNECVPRKSSTTLT